MLRRAEWWTFAIRFAAVHRYSPPSSTCTTLMFTCDITSPCTVTYWPIMNLRAKHQKFITLRNVTRFTMAISGDFSRFACQRKEKQKLPGRACNSRVPQWTVQFDLIFIVSTLHGILFANRQKVVTLFSPTWRSRHRYLNNSNFA